LNIRNLTINNSKLFIGDAKENFSFLGYCFNSGIISLEKSYIKRIIAGWKSILKYKNYNLSKKKYLLRRIMGHPEKNFNYQFQKIIKDKPQINNSEQIKKLSEDFFRILTDFIFGKYSPRNRRLLRKEIEYLKIKSLYNFYLDFHYERNKRTN